MTIDHDRSIETTDRNIDPNREPPEPTQRELDAAADDLFWTDVPQIPMNDIVDILHGIASGKCIFLNSLTDNDIRQAHDAAERLRTTVRQLAIDGRK